METSLKSARLANNRITLLATVKSRTIIWFARENLLLTTVMEGESVTNARMLAIGNAITSGSFLLFSPSAGYLAIAVCLLWLSISLFLCGKTK